MQHQPHYHFSGPTDSFLKQGKKEIAQSVSAGIDDFLYQKPNGKKLREEALGKLAVYAHIPYLAAGLVIGLLVAKLAK